MLYLLRDGRVLNWLFCLLKSLRRRESLLFAASSPAMFRCWLRSCILSFNGAGEGLQILNLSFAGEIQSADVSNLLLINSSAPVSGKLVVSSIPCINGGICFLCHADPASESKHNAMGGNEMVARRRSNGDFHYNGNKMQ